MIPNIEEDAATSITEGSFDTTHRIIPHTSNNEEIEEGTWDIVVDGQGIVAFLGRL